MGRSIMTRCVHLEDEEAQKNTMVRLVIRFIRLLHLRIPVWDKARDMITADCKTLQGSNLKRRLLLLKTERMLLLFPPACLQLPP